MRSARTLIARPFILALFAAVLSAWTPSPPVGTSTLYSQSYQFTGQCTGADMVYSWSINGAQGAGGSTAVPALGTPTQQYPNGTPPTPGQPGSSFLYPWLPTDITIRGADLVLVPPAAGDIGPTYMPQYSFLMIGNDADGDAMLWLPAGSLNAHTAFPAGTGFGFPGTQNMWNLGYIDLHGSCTPGMIANVEMTLYFTEP